MGTYQAGEFSKEYKPTESCCERINDALRGQQLCITRYEGGMCYLQTPEDMSPTDALSALQKAAAKVLGEK